MKTSGAYSWTPDYSIDCMFFIYWLLFFPLMFTGKNHVKPFLGLLSVTKIEFASIATDLLS